MIRFVLLAAALSACAADDEIEIGVYVSRAEIHVDTSQPAALAVPNVTLGVDGGVRSHYVTIGAVWLSLDNGLTQHLDLGLDEGAIDVPAHASLGLALVNHSTRNSELAPLCQSTHPVTVYVDTPGFESPTLAPGAPLTIFCP